MKNIIHWNNGSNGIAGCGDIEIEFSSELSYVTCIKCLEYFIYCDSTSKIIKFNKKLMDSVKNRLEYLKELE